MRAREEGWEIVDRWEFERLCGLRIHFNNMRHNRSEIESVGGFWHCLEEAKSGGKVLVSR